MSRRPLLLALPAVTLVLISTASTCEEDHEQPNIVLTDPDYRVPLGGVYTEPGATAVDEQDGVLDPASIVIDTGEVTTDSVAEFAVDYYVEDAAGNADSVERLVAVYARNTDYAGSWQVTETCDDTAGFDYTVDISTDPSDSTVLLLSNLRERGSGHVVRLDVFGRLASRFSLGDTLELYKYFGDGELNYGTLDAFEFELRYEESDTIDFFTDCEAVFSKP